MAKSKVFNVDDYLVNSTVTVVIKGKEYKVSDIPFGMKSEDKEVTEESQKKMLADIVKCPISELDGYGIAAVGAIMRYLTENLFPESSRKEA
jgi:hypothetical protein